MRPTRRWGTPAILLALLPLAPLASAAQGMPTAAPAERGVSSERLARLDSVMQAYVDQDRIAGMVALVARGGRVVHLKGYGSRDVAARDAMAVDDIFRIASQTKALTSVAAMILVEEGRLTLNEPVSRHLPSFAQTRVRAGTGDVPAARPITVRDLLTHTSGVSYGWGPDEARYREAGVLGWYFADKDEPIGATIDRLATIPFDAQPGSRYIYGFSTDILGAVVERASGMSLDEFIRRRILQPLKMNDTHFYLPREKADRLVTVYSAREGGGIERAPDRGREAQGEYLEGPRKSFSGGAGLLSTASDYGRFLQMLLNGGELEGARILSPAAVRLMTTDHIGELFGRPGMGFGLGFEVLEDPGAAARMGSPGAFGWGGAYHSTYWVDPEQELVVVFLSQLIPARGLDLQEKFRNLVYQALVEPAS